jgi:hypothetical protein
LDIHYTTIDNPWYKVEFYRDATTPLGTGWINSAALVGQQLAAAR